MKKNGDIEISVHMHNIGDVSRAVHGYICAISTKYTSVPATDLKESSATNILEPGSGKYPPIIRLSTYLGNIHLT